MHNHHIYAVSKPDELSDYTATGPTFSLEPSAGLPVRYASKGIASRVFNPIPIDIEDLSQRPETKDTAVYYYEEAGYPKDKVISWSSITWTEYRAQSRQFARSLISCGFQPYEGVAICGFNGLYWMVSAVGTMYAVGLTAGTYTTNTPLACKYIADHSKSRVVVVDNAATLMKYSEVELATVHHIVVADNNVPSKYVGVKSPQSKYGRDFVVSWTEFMSWSKTVPESELESRMKQLSVENCCSLIYTSGTTGDPKGVMISHDNLQFTARSILESLAGTIDNIFLEKQSRIISYLPLSHIAAFILDFVGPIVLSIDVNLPNEIYFSRPDALKGSLSLTLKSVRPTLFFGVPRVWEKMIEGIKAKAAANPPGWLKQQVINYSKVKSLEYSTNCQSGGNGQVPWLYHLICRPLHHKVKAAMGLDQAHLLFTGAAPTQKSTFEYLASLGINLLEVYGMSETGGSGAINTPRQFLFGSSGVPICGQEIKIEHVPGRDKPNEGEICFRGRHVMMGYMHEEQKNRECIDTEGWLHSGDIGKMDEHHHLFIVGRIKEIIITAGGENIAPVPIEEEIKRLLPAISNAIMIGDKRKYNVMLITLKTKQDLNTSEFTDQLVAEAAGLVKDVTTISEAKASESYQKHIQKAITDYNNGTFCVSNAQKIQKFAILPVDLSIPGGELTGTLKLKRNVIVEKYADIIESLY